MSAEDVKLFTREELKSRNTRTDAVMIIHNGVYDVTHFLDEHPGGEEVLLEQAGKDATEPFEDVSHSSDARSLMVKYKIGNACGVYESRYCTPKVQKRPVQHFQKTVSPKFRSEARVVAVVELQDGRKTGIHYCTGLLYRRVRSPKAGLV